MATIKEVAALAGVSIATVSCTLSGKKTVSYPTQVKVREAIDKLGYIPNENARKLKLRKSREIGVLLTSIDDIYHGEIFKGITSVIQKNNFSVNIGFSNNQPKVEIEIVNDFISRDFAGIILISCMTNDRAYFERFLSRDIPVVFIERRPDIGGINFAGISNGKTIRFLMEKLRSVKVSRVSLYCGNPTISSEKDCALAFSDYCDKHPSLSASEINYTNMSKEDAFRVALKELGNKPKPEAIIATSDNIARGITESAHVLGISLSDCIFAAFSEETWIGTGKNPWVLQTSRPAFNLGAAGASLLLRCVTEQNPRLNETLIFDDNIINTGVTLPALTQKRVNPVPPKKTKQIPELRMLLWNSNMTSALQILTRKFRNDCGISLIIETEPQNTLPLRIVADAASPRPQFDIYMFDMPWLNYLVQNGYLEDLTDFITEDRNFLTSVIRENLNNSLYKNRYYSIPFIGGAQILFYRSDIFEDPVIIKDYFVRYKTKLQPPRTWNEFNNVARFFTRGYNKTSPVEYGTSSPGIIAEELCPEIYSRVWGFQGTLFSKTNLPQFNTPNNRMAFENFLNLQNYTSRFLFNTSINDTVNDFCSGKTVMLNTYTEYANKIMNTIHENIFKLGFTFMPHRTPISVGWNLGINLLSVKKEAALRFFKWLYRKDVNYYLTILDGQSTSIYPYENNELLKLYPWMQITMDNFKYARKRITSNRKNSIIIPWNRIEDIIYRYTRFIVEGMPIEQSLEAMNGEITDLMTVYGHFRGNN
ncbi:MAG: extracellular solute-binding protein [Spirochaetaceae bacterium]|jgi:multiple sugar transport system substrate-binding protein|nr:extracellular solute-binding protein [Spirochaetaceae bacterium]